MPKIGDLFIQIGAAIGDFEKGLVKVSRDLKKFGREMTEVGRTLSIGITAPITGIAVAALKSFASIGIGGDKLTNAFKELKAQGTLSLASLGEEIVKIFNVKGILASITDAIRNVTDWFKNLDESTKKVILTVGLFVAAIGPAILIVGKLAKVIGGLGLLIKGLLGIPGLVAILAVAVIGWGSYKLAVEASTSAAERSIAKQKKLNELIAEQEEKIRKRAPQPLPQTALAPLELQGLRPFDEAKERVQLELFRARLDAEKATEIQRERSAAAELKAAEAAKAVDVAIESLAKKEKELIESEQLLGNSFESTRALLEAQQKAYIELRAAGQGLDPVVIGLGIRMEELKEKLRIEEVAKNSADALERLNAKIKDITKEEEVFGITSDTLKAKLDAVKEAMIALGAAHPAIPALRIELENLSAALKEQPSLFDAISAKVEDLHVITEEAVNALFGLLQTFSQGVSDALAQIIVFGESASEAFKELGKRLVALLLATLVEMAVLELVHVALSKIFTAKRGGAQIGVNIARAGTAAYAAAVESQGLKGLITGLVYAAIAIASAKGIAATGGAAGHSAAKSIAGAQQGGIFTRPTISALAERGPEIVLNEGNVRRFFGDMNRNRSQTINVMLDQRSILRAVIQGMPQEILLRGIS